MIAPNNRSQSCVNGSGPYADDRNEINKRNMIPMTNVQRSAQIITRCLAVSIAVAYGIGAAFAQSPQTPVPAPCNMGGTANYSKTVGGTSITLIPAPPQGVTRTGIFIELLTASATLAINPTGGTASTTATPNIVITTGGTAPQNTGYINFASMGFIPQGAITAIADTSGRVVSAFACPS